MAESFKKRANELAGKVIHSNNSMNFTAVILMIIFATIICCALN